MGIQRRLEAVSLVEEGEKPVEDPSALLDKHLSTSERLESLAVKIASANQDNNVQFGGHTLTLSKALAKREQLRFRVNFLRGFHESLVTGTRSRYYGSDTGKITRIIHPSEIETQLNHASSDLRNLNSAIQEKNWTTDLEMATIPAE